MCIWLRCRQIEWKVSHFKQFNNKKVYRPPFHSQIKLGNSLMCKKTVWNQSLEITRKLCRLYNTQLGNLCQMQRKQSLVELSQKASVWLKMNRKKKEDGVCLSSLLKSLCTLWKSVCTLSHVLLWTYAHLKTDVPSARHSGCLSCSLWAAFCMACVTANQ